MARPKQGQGEVKARPKLGQGNANHNYNLMGFDTIEINLVELEKELKNFLQPSIRRK